MWFWSPPTKVSRMGRYRANIIKGWILSTAVAVLCALSACASKPIEGPSLLQEAITLEQRSIRAAQSQNFALADNLAAESLDLYTVLDNSDGQMRLLTLRTRLAIQGGLQDRARRFLKRARALLRDEDMDSAYELALMAGHISENRKREYERALSFTEDPLRQAVAMTYLGRFVEARALVEKIEPASRRELDDLGLVLYEYAQSANVRADADTALGLYKTAENILGISDALFLLGKIALRDKDKLAARDYFGRALAVNQRLGDKSRIQISEQALAGLSE